MEATHGITHVPLSALKPAETNVRAVPAGDDAFEKLKASIRAHGLIQNLCVRPLGNGANGSYGVIGGLRRLAALKALAEDGDIGTDTPVPCRIAGSDDDDTELSLAENELRVAMHPADQVVAFRRLADEGLTAAEIGARFGMATTTVEQRLRLGGLAPEIIAAAREDRVNLEQMKAFAGTADQGRQRALWERLKDQPAVPHAGYIQRELANGWYSAGSTCAKIVGLRAYQEAGGTVERDLFAADDERGITLTDTALLEGLCMERLEARAAELRKEGWKWAESRLDGRIEATDGYGRVRGEAAEPTAEQRAESVRINTRLEEIRQEFEAHPEWNDFQGEDDTHPAFELVAETEQLEDDDRRLMYETSMRRSYPAEMKALAGCIVSIGYSGIEVTEGLVREEDTEAVKALVDKLEQEAGRIPEDPLGNTGYRDPGTNLSPEAKATQRLKEAGISAALGDHLRLVRNGIIKAELSDSFSAAFDLAAYQLAVTAFERNGRSNQPLDISLTKTADSPGGKPDEEAMFHAASPGPAALEANRESLPLDWLAEPDLAKRFAAFSALPLKERKRLFAAAVARTLKPQLSFDYGAHPETEATVARLGIGFAKTWRPDVELYWNRMRKGEMLGIARRVLGAEWAAAHAKDKKAELAAAMGAAFGAGDDAGDLARETRKAALAWTPNGFGPFEPARTADE